MWFNNLVGEGRCDLVDTWWQTETGGIAIAPRPSGKAADILPAKPMRPMLGMNPVLLNEHCQELQGNNVAGALCMKTPWPGIGKEHCLKKIGPVHTKYWLFYFIWVYQRWAQLT